MKSSIKLLINIFVFFPFFVFCQKQFSSYQIDDFYRRKINALQSLPTYAPSCEVLYNTFILCEDCIVNNIPGDFVECGVAAGGQIAVMGYACQRYGITSDKRKIHLFDSFEGIPLAGPNDTAQPGIGAITHNNNVEDLNSLLVSSGIAVHSLENVQCNMRHCGINEQLLVYHKGWFQNVMPLSAPTISQISVLRLDGDLYESTMVCLEHLYPKVSKGGYVIIDDYSSLTGCRNAVHEYLAKHNLSPQIIIVPNGGGPVYWRVE